MFQKILVVALLFLTSHTFAQHLEAILSDTKLPAPAHGTQVVYDGEDSIYVMGGRNPINNSYQKDILKFSVAAQTLDKVGTMDPVEHGSAVAGDEILFFGGREYMNDKYEYQAKVWSYKPDGTSDWTRVGGLPSDAGFTSSVWDQGEYTYVFGGSGTSGGLNTISRYSSVTNVSVVGELPGPRYGSSAVWDETTGDAYVFGGYDSVGILNDIVKFNPAKNTVVKLNVTLPKVTYYSCAVWTGTQAYIIGGGTYDGVHSVASFNPSTSEVLNVPVNYFPAHLFGHGCAFVKKLNRIFVFGGSAGSLRDKIMYIDLGPSPTNPTTTTPIPITTTTTRPGNATNCKNKACGTRFADPYCCKIFYQCENQEAVLRHCPSQLHFNPAHRECDLLEIVKRRSVDE